MEFSISGLRNVQEVAAAEQAVRTFREHQVTEPAKVDITATEALPTGLADRIQRIHRGLTRPGPLPAIYGAELRVLYEAGTEAINLEAIASKVGVSASEVTAHLSKMSARMKRIATPAELEALPKAFLLLGDIEPTDDGSSKKYRLTLAGREAVRRLLRIAD